MHFMLPFFAVKLMKCCVLLVLWERNVEAVQCQSYDGPCAFQSQTKAVWMSEDVH